ncbi:hypothetical protein [Morganella psychrotolerans]|uniref:Uncharacterized protein n=1 Tax=Morganella psychrotolerans TaxID=368603 RepID=A0A1B8HF97_9GAMM|nr:hypothetical protein [Morganella psychrotolerans]OBU07748.1 hypothetical protein AYY18_05870 [Morganella psychrotolerans]
MTDDIYLVILLVVIPSAIFMTKSYVTSKITKSMEYNYNLRLELIKNGKNKEIEILKNENNKEIEILKNENNKKIEILKNELTQEKYIFNRKFDEYVLLMKSLDNYNLESLNLINELITNKMMEFYGEYHKSGRKYTPKVKEIEVEFNNLCMTELSNLKTKSAHYYSQMQSIKYIGSNNVNKLIAQLSLDYAHLDRYLNNSINYISENSWLIFTGEISAMDVPKPPCDINETRELIIKTCREELGISDS